MAEPKHVAAALRAIETLDDPDRLRRLMQNARSAGNEEVETAAFAKLAEILPEADDDPFAFEVWRSVHAIEELETQDRGRTARISRIRQKIGRDGARQTLIDLAEKPQSQAGFDMLIARGLSSLTFEAIILRHRADFDTSTVEAAERKLSSAGVDLSTLT